MPSFVGLVVCLPGESGDVTLTAVSSRPDRQSHTSLRFSVSGGDGRLTRLTLYGHQPGALVDLGADLVDVWSPAADAEAGAQRISDIRLDQDLPAPTLVPGLAGLANRSTLNRAEGLLVNAGVDPEDAVLQLRRRASAAGLDPLTYAGQLLAAAGGSV